MPTPPRARQLHPFARQGPEFPNASHIPYGDFYNKELIKLCGDGSAKLGPGCLYNIREDPTEHHDVAAEHPDVAAALHRRLAELRPSKFQPPSAVADPKAAVGEFTNCVRQINANGGFYGPWL